MTLDTGLAFKFMQINYKYGLLDDMGSIVGDGLDAAMAERGLDMEDLLNAVDGASEQTVEKINALVEKWATLGLRLAANEPATRLLAYLLKKPAVRRGAVKVATVAIGKRLALIGAPTGGTLEVGN